MATGVRRAVVVVMLRVVVRAAAADRRAVVETNLENMFGLLATRHENEKKGGWRGGENTKQRYILVSIGGAATLGNECGMLERENDAHAQLLR